MEYSVHVKMTPKGAQASGEVERKNASLMKRICIAQSEVWGWKRFTDVLTIQKELRGKLPDITTPQRDLETRDRC